MKVDGIEVGDTNKSIYEYKGRDLKSLNIEEWLQFAKANKEFGEPGIAYDELRAIHEGIELLGNRPLTILETGMCFGTTTRYFLVRKLKYGGEVNSVESRIRPLFKKAMTDLGLWQELNVLEGNSMKVPWNKGIDVLFIDSEHALSDALGEYMRYRVFLNNNAIVGFHDADACYGVSRAIEIITGELDSLKLVSRSTGQAGFGLKVFQLDALNVVQNRIGRQKRKEKENAG